MDENGHVNFDLPEAIDFKRMLKDLRMLMKGQSVDLVEYTFNNPDKFPKTFRWHSTPIIIIEGLFIFHYRKLASLFDLKLFIDAEDSIKLNRRLERDFLERAMSKEQILYQWENHVQPAFEKYLLPYQNEVDMVIMNNTHFERSFNIIVDHFKQILI